MTAAMRKVLEAVARLGAVHVSDLPTDMREKLVALGMIEAADAHNWLRLTHAGREAVDENADTP